MKRTTVSGALFVAPLVMAGTLFGGAALADSQTIALQLDTVCVDASSHQAIYALQNKNNFDVNVNYTNLDTHVSGSFVVPANSFHGDRDPVNNPGLVAGYSADYDPAYANNTTSFTADGWTSPAVTNAQSSVACTPSQLPTTGGNTTTPGGNGGGTTTGTTDTTGGKGADTDTETVTASSPTAAVRPELAYTGASQIVPYTAAALLAVAVLGTTIAVRKNVL